MKMQKNQNYQKQTGAFKFDVELLLFVFWLMIASATGVNYASAAADPSADIFFLISLVSMLIFFLKLFLLIFDCLVFDAYP